MSVFFFFSKLQTILLYKSGVMNCILKLKDLLLKESQYFLRLCFSEIQRCVCFTQSVGAYFPDRPSLYQLCGI